MRAASLGTTNVFAFKLATELTSEQCVVVVVASELERL